MQPLEALVRWGDCSEIFNMARCEGVVLVVEDHPLVRMSVLEVIVEAGFETLEASSAVDAIRILEARPDIHLVFTDAEMPGTMDGLELAHYIRNRWPPVKLIVVSGKVAIDSQEIPPGAKFFPKPYRETSIVQAMTGMLSGAP
jgi:two-component system, response regulator PdtaR